MIEIDNDFDRFVEIFGRDALCRRGCLIRTKFRSGKDDRFSPRYDEIITAPDVVIESSDVYTGLVHQDPGNGVACLAEFICVLDDALPRTGSFGFVLIIDRNVRTFQDRADLGRRRREGNSIYVVQGIVLRPLRPPIDHSDRLAVGVQERRPFIPVVGLDTCLDQIAKRAVKHIEVPVRIRKSNSVRIERFGYYTRRDGGGQESVIAFESADQQAVFSICQRVGIGERQSLRQFALLPGK